MKKKSLVIWASLSFVGVAAAVLGAWGYLSSSPRVSSDVTAAPEQVIKKPDDADKTTVLKGESGAMSESAKRVDAKLDLAKDKPAPRRLVPAQGRSNKAVHQVPIRPAPTPGLATQPGAEQPATDAQTEPTEPETADGTEEQTQGTGISPVTAEKLSSLALGMTYEQVASVMGDRGRQLGDGQAVAYQPVGWGTVEWGSREKGLFTATFNADEQLVAVDAFNVPGAEILAESPGNAVRNWLNNALSQDRLAVRVPVVTIKPSGPGNYEYSGALVSERGNRVGEIGGFYRLGDGVTTVASGDEEPYKRLLEGIYDITWEDGSNASNAFSLVEH